MQEQLDADAERLRAQNNPERKSQCDPCAGRRSDGEKEEKEKDGNDDEGDSRGADRRVFDNAEISQQAGINEPHGQSSQHAECGSAVNVASDKCYNNRCDHRHKSQKEFRRHSCSLIFIVIFSLVRSSTE